MMLSFLPEAFVNSSVDGVQLFAQKFKQDIYNIFLFIYELFCVAEQPNKSPQKIYKSILQFIDSCIAFDEFQIKILKVLLSILICNLLIISILWQFFGRQICDRFTRPGM